MRCGLVGNAGETRGSLEPWLLACADRNQRTCGQLRARAAPRQLENGIRPSPD